MIAKIYEMADAILLARKQRGLTRAELARLAGVSPKTIAKIENGNGGGVSVAIYLKIFAALGVAVKIEM